MVRRIKLGRGLRGAALLVAVCAALWAADGLRHVASALPQDTECFSCHAAKGLQMRLGQTRGYSDEEALRFKGPAHAKVACVQCHPQAGTRPHPQGMKPVACATCHQVAPGHMPARDKNLPAGRHTPTCTDCHGHHDMRPPSDLLAPVNRRNVVQVCAKCHSDAMPGGAAGEGPAKTFARSVHGRALAAEGEAHAPVCTDCHGSHPPQGPEVGASPVNYQHIASTCGKCHTAIYKEYAQSVHASAVASGIKDAPTCTSCHGEHNIQSPQFPGSPTYATHVTDLCVSCHENKRIVKLYGLPDRRLATYLQSYHGQANRFGSVKVANCASCHQFHGILPSSDPRSSIYPANLKTTCGKCHPGASDNFARGQVHLQPTPTVDWMVFLVKFAYWMIITGTLGGFMMYMLLDLLAYRRERKLPRTHEMELLLRDYPAPPRRRLLRMDSGERVQHLVLFISFTLLVLTGTALLVPETSYAQIIVTLSGGPVGRAYVHRFAALALVGLGLYHVYYVITNPRGRESFIRGLPTRKDILDAIQTVKYLIGRAKHRPCFGRYNYLEKFEYGAVVWGSFVMTLTGLIMWLENISLRLLPKWTWDMAKAVHGYEAILAFSTILIWHFYHTLWKPGIFPGNRTWLWGYLSPEEFAHEHPLEYAEAVGLLPSETQRLLGGYADRLLLPHPEQPEDGSEPAEAADAED